MSVIASLEMANWTSASAAEWRHSLYSCCHGNVVCLSYEGER